MSDRKKCPEAHNSGSLNYLFGGNQSKQIGNFKGIPLQLIVLVWVGIINDPCNT